MLSEFIRSEHSYSALPLAGTADRPEVRSTRSSRTKVKSPQNSTPAVDRRPTCLTHVITNYSVHWTIASSALGWLLVFSLYGYLWISLKCQQLSWRKKLVGVAGLEPASLPTGMSDGCSSWATLRQFNFTSMKFTNFPRYNPFQKWSPPILTNLIIDRISNVEFRSSKFNILYSNSRPPWFDCVFSLFISLPSF